MLGYTEPALLATDLQSITFPEDLDADLDNMRALLDARIVGYQMEKRYLHRDGRVIWSQLDMSMVRRSSGECEFLVAQIQDITERKTLTCMKDEFVSLVSHELRAPLTSIRASLAMIVGMRDVSLPAPVQRLIDISHSNCERLVALVNGILDLDKIASGHMQFDLTDESLACVTQRAVQVSTAASIRPDVHISLEYIDPDIIVYVDAERYLQVMTNLLSNALKFAPADSEIEIGAQLRDGSVRVFVRDHGPGIPEDFRGRIFGKFAQAESVSNHKGGTGLGLHISRELVEHMNGTMGFVTQEGLGTTFWVEFPCVSPDKRRLRMT
jgi:PAS domain S-box-containing protein